MADAQKMTVKVELDPQSIAALETLLAEVAFHANGMRRALTQYRQTTEATPPASQPQDKP